MIALHLRQDLLVASFGKASRHILLCPRDRKCLKSMMQNAVYETNGDAGHLEESETMTVAAALDADTIFKSAGTRGEPCV